MNTKLSPESEQFICDEIEAGNFTDRAEVLNAGVLLLRERSRLIRDLQDGAESGGAIPAAEVFERLRQKAEALDAENS